MPTVSGRAPLVAAFLLYFVLVAALIVSVPWGSAPDEAAHGEYVQAIASTHGLPVFRGQSPPAPGYEFHQPPLYYLLAAPIQAILPANVQHHAVRFLSLGIGLVTIWVVWMAANLLFGRGSRASAFCALGVALSPLHQGVGACVNNDGLAGLWAAGLFYLVARAWLEEPTKKLILVLGVVAGLGALTKLTVLPLGAWAFIAVAVALSKKGQRPITALLPALVIALLLAAPMLIRNQSLYGDPFAYTLFSRAADKIAPGFPEFSAGGFSFLSYARAMIWQILGTTWGFFGGPNTLIAATGTLNRNGPGFPNPLWLGPFTIAVFVPLLGVWGAWKNHHSAGSPVEGRGLLSWWIAGVFLIVALWANFAYAHFAGGQARYLHGALLPITLLVAGGLSKSRVGFLTALLLALTMLGLSLANILFWKTLV